MTNTSNPARHEAIRLRKQGLSYNEIRQTVRVAKSTLSLWLKTIALNPRQQQRLYTKQIAILSRGAQSQKERRAREVAQIIEQAKAEISLPISSAAYRLMGAALYWAEGGKSGLFSITNSDPHLIAFIVGWMEKVFRVPRVTLKARLNIYAQQSERSIIRFWSDLTGIPRNNFGKSFIKPVGKGFKKNNLYYGTINIYIPKSVDLRYRTFGWIQKALEGSTPHVTLTQRKWQSLTKTQRPVNLR